MSFIDRDITIHVSDSALMHLLLAGMEILRVKKRKNAKPLETAGLLWGYAKDDEINGMDHVTVEHVSTDTYADHTPDSVGLSDQTTDAKRALIAQRWPHLSMIGDLHTHPYRNYSQAVKDKGGASPKETMTHTRTGVHLGRGPVVWAWPSP